MLDDDIHWDGGVRCDKNCVANKKRKPGELIIRGLAGQNHLAQEIHDETKAAIENYLLNHPDYDPMYDPDLQGRYGAIFRGVRQEYWADRAIEAGICKYCISESYNLMMYYDFRIKVNQTGWDASKVDWSGVALDSISTALSVVALNEVTQTLKIGEAYQDAAQYGAAGNGIRSGLEATDGPGIALTVAGFIPGPPGAIASGGSVMKGLSAGVYNYYYQPSIPR